jgi:hypothetical protein
MMFICKLANQRRQRLPIHRFYSHAGTQVSKKILLCSLDEDRHSIFGKTNVTGHIFKIVCHQCRLSFHLELIRNRVVSREVWIKQALVLRTRAILMLFEKFTRACYIQIALEIILSRPQAQCSTSRWLAASNNCALYNLYYFVLFALKS